MLSSYIISAIGGLATFAEIILSGVVGIWLLKNFKFALGANIISLAKGDIRPDEFIKLNIAMAVGAILLILPGFLSDIVGVLLQFEFIALIISSRLSKNKPTNNNFKSQYKGDDDVIDVEIIDSNHTAIK